jgi:hypothetical protein
MKSSLFALLLLTTVFVSCKKNTDPVTPAAATFPDIIAPGTWTINSTQLATEDKLKSLNGVTVTFTSDGNGTASLSGKNTTGTWVWGGASYYGNPSPNTKTVTFNFGATAPYNRLSKSWTITDASKSLITLDSANPAENEHMTLTK